MMRVMEARVRVEEDELASERASQRPQLTFSMRGGEERFSDPDGVELLGETGSAALQGKQLLYDGGNTRNRILEARAKLETSQAALRRTKEEIALETASAYIDVIKYTRLLELAEQSAYLHLDALDKIEEKYTAGAGPKADYLLVKARLAKANATIESRKRLLKSAQAEFYRLTDRFPSRLQEPEFPAWALPESIDQVDLTRNPSVLRAHSELKASYSRRNVAESSFRPTVNFVVEGDTAKSERFETLQEDAMALVTLSYNLFDGGRRRAEIRKANSQLDESQWKLRDTILETETAFAKAWNELTAAEERIHLLREHRDTMETVADAYHQQFELGQRALINLLDVENELSTARSSVEEERLNKLQAVYKLLAAMGELSSTLNYKANPK